MEKFPSLGHVRGTGWRRRRRGQSSFPLKTKVTSPTSISGGRGKRKRMMKRGRGRVEVACWLAKPHNPSKSRAKGIEDA